MEGKVEEAKNQSEELSLLRVNLFDTMTERTELESTVAVLEEELVSQRESCSATKCKLQEMEQHLQDCLAQAELKSAELAIRLQEVEAIEARYAKLADRTFPVAIIFLVPHDAMMGSAA